MILQIISAIGSVPQHMGTRDGYKEAIEYFEIVGSSGETRNNHVERPMGNRVGQFARPISQLKLKHKMEVSNFLCTFNPK